MKIIASIDLGSSGTRAILKTDRMTQPTVLFIEPDLRRVDPNELHRFLEKREASLPRPCDEAWVQLGDRCYAVGYLARQLDSRPHLEANKVELAAPKILALLGSLMQERKLGSQAELVLGVVLPKNETEDSDTLKSELKQYGENFIFRGQDYCFKFEHLDCSLAEGSGTIYLHLARYGVNYLQDHNTLFVMFGHRNTTAFPYVRGINEGYSTTDEGMKILVDYVQRETPKLDLNALSAVIFEMGQDVREDHPALSKLVRPDMRADYKQEIFRKVCDAVPTARELYWERVSQWLDRVKPRAVTHLVFAGGGARYLKSELDSKYANYHLDYGDAYATEIAEKFGTTQRGSQEATDYRLVDAWGIYKSLLKQVLMVGVS